MSHKVTLVRVLTAATGNSTPITLGAKYSVLFQTPAEAGAMDGRTYTYLIVDGNNFELGKGVYTASGTTLSRATVLSSGVNGTLGTSRITLSGTAQVRFIEAAEDMDGVRGTRAVTGTSDTLNNSDLGYVVTYANAGAVAVSLAQASVSNLFLDGWATWVRIKGAGAVTITPATSTINGAATLVLAANQGAMIWSDGTNYQAFIFRGDIGTLGGAALLNVGMATGTVAAGDDARFSSAWRTGSARLTFQTTADTGWILADDGSIGDASSGATTRANADTSALFTVLYAITSLVIQDSSGSTVARGASAAADFAAHRRLIIPKTLGRAIAIAGSGSGLTARALGTTAGSETETPTIAKTAAHTHNLGLFGTPGAPPDMSFSTVASMSSSASGLSNTIQTVTQGGGAALNIVPPEFFINIEIKL